MDHPEVRRLYKYQSFTSESLENLINKSIWASKPNDLNDPFEVSVRYKQQSPPTESTLLGIVVESLRRQGASDEEMKRFVVEAAIDMKTDRKRFEDEAKKVVALWNQKLGEQQQSIGVFSLTACYDRQPKDQLLWSHYGDSHKGYVLGFERNADNHLALAQRVIYNNLDHVDINTLSPPYVLYDALVSKSPIWEYEDEYRLSYSEGNRCYGWPGKPVSVTFGLRMGKAQRLTIWNAMHSEPGIEFFETVKLDDRLEIQYKKIHDPQDYFESIAQEATSGTVYEV